MEESFAMPAWALIPFGIMLLMIAIGPLIAEHWWEKNRNKLLVSALLGTPTATYLVIVNLGVALEHQILYDYIPFIVLLLALFVVAGGIHMSGDIKAKPSINTLFMGVGYILASIMGTTGAAMLIIRPLLSTNSQREYKTHTILFFIAAVANCGGLLTPLGDPPLFMLYLRGAPFTWFMHLLPEWLFVGTILLTIYYFTDRYFYKKEHWVNLSADTREITPIRIGGRFNLFLLVGIVLTVAFVTPNNIPQMNEEGAHFWVKFLREITLLTITTLSIYGTKKKLRYELNKFSWRPIIEVAVVFLGIFITMTPALIYLTNNANKLGLTESWHFYYSTGLLSSFLDNTPTAVALHGVATGITESTLTNTPIVANIPEVLLKSISVASVFFGSLTYIGNGPNFMIKAIAEESGIKMPSFFGYIFKFSLLVLLPIYILVQVLFL